MAPQRKSIFVMGVREAPDKSVSAEEIEKAIQDQMKKLDELGFDVFVQNIDIDSPTTMDDIRANLARGPWDGISIGFGLRGTPELSPMFEDIVNLCIKESKQPMAKMLFAVGPQNVTDTLLRAFPEHAK